METPDIPEEIQDDIHLAEVINEVVEETEEDLDKIVVLWTD